MRFRIAGTLLCVLCGCDLPGEAPAFVDATELFQIGGAESQVDLPALPGSVVAVNNGLLIMTPGYLPLRVDAVGENAQVVGRRGRGPGEFVAPFTAVETPGDTLAVLDYAQGRIQLIDPSGEAGRTIRIGGAFFSLHPIDWPHDVFASGPGPRGQEARFFRLDLSGDDGRTLSRFGADEDRDQFALEPRVTDLDEGQFWSVSRDRYEIESWLVDGTLERALPADPDWFRGRSSRSLHRDTIPAPFVWAVSRGETSNLLWIFSRVARDDWGAAWDGLGDTDVPSVSSLYHTIVEVRDSNSGDLIASTFLPGVPISVLSGGRLVNVSEDDAGRPTLTVYSYRLARRLKD